jgi:hypothetical protein
VLASSFKPLGSTRKDDGSFSVFAEGPDRVEGVARILLEAEPGAVTLDGQPLPAEARTWDPATKTLLVRFPNAPTGHSLNVAPAR